MQKAGRHADVFVFAHHPILKVENCDQRDARQWRFYILATERLPATQKKIGLGPLVNKLKAAEATFETLAAEISTLLP